MQRSSVVYNKQTSSKGTRLTSNDKTIVWAKVTFVIVWF